MWTTDNAAETPLQGRATPCANTACAGFSLVELLVVILILGVLATIAVPTLLEQRDRAGEAAVQADLRQAATFQVGQLQSGKTLATNLEELEELGFRLSHNVKILNPDQFVSDVDDDEFCIEAQAAQGTGQTWLASSGEGFAPVQPGSC